MQISQTAKSDVYDVSKSAIIMLSKEFTEQAFYTVFNCSRQMVCFNPVKGLILSKASTSKHLSRINATPVVLATPSVESFKSIHANPFDSLVLIPKYSKEYDHRLFVDNVGYAISVKVRSLQTSYIRGGHEVNIINMNGLFLSAAACANNLCQLDYEAVGIEFCKSEGAEWEKFFICPINPKWISSKLKEYCSNELTKHVISSSEMFPIVSLPRFMGNDMMFKSSWGELIEQVRKNVQRKVVGKGKMHLNQEKRLSYVIGPNYDYLGRSNQAHKGNAFSLPTHRNYARRSLHQPELGPCIVSTARNEGIYLADWCAYHYSLGFEHIYLYTNDNEDLTVEIATRIAQITGKLTLIENKLTDRCSLPQYKAYRHAFSISTDVLKHSWCAVIDIDEYIAIKPKKGIGSNINFLISSLDRKALFAPDIITLNWVFAGLDRYPSFPAMPLSLPVRIDLALSANPHIKSIFKPHQFLASHCHYPVENPSFIPSVIDSFGDIYSSYFTSIEPGISPWPKIKQGAVVHYYHKSFPEFIWKSMRNTGDQPVGPHSSSYAERMEAYMNEFVADRAIKHKALEWVKDAHGIMKTNVSGESIANDQILRELSLETWAYMRDSICKVVKKEFKENVVFEAEALLLFSCDQ